MEGSKSYIDSTRCEFRQNMKDLLLKLFKIISEWVYLKTRSQVCNSHNIAKNVHEKRSASILTTINDQVEELIVRISSGREIGHHIVAGPFLYYPGAGFNRICLVPPNSNSDEDTLFEVVAGDTAKQAKAFYKHFSPEKARQLKELGWNVKSSFHFAWWSKNIFWPDNHKTIQIDDYITFGTWALRESFIRQFERREFRILQESNNRIDKRL